MRPPSARPRPVWRAPRTPWRRWPACCRPAASSIAPAGSATSCGCTAPAATGP
jgi:hypothetical protein